MFCAVPMQVANYRAPIRSAIASSRTATGSTNGFGHTIAATEKSRAKTTRIRKALMPAESCVVRMQAVKSWVDGAAVMQVAKTCVWHPESIGRVLGDTSASPECGPIAQSFCSSAAIFAPSG